MSARSDVLLDVDLPLPGRQEGKVRVSYDLGGRPERRLIVTTDRLSAFDRVLGAVPGKGEALNRLSWWWFSQLEDLVDHHALALPDPNALVALSARPLPVEVVVRAAITGVTSTSLWVRYAAGERVLDGHRLPDGLRKNELLPTPLITPTTKAAAGGHDEPLSCADVVARGLVDAERWAQVQAVALAVFERGRRLGADAGLVLADTKYELGLAADGRLLLIDEVHTSDSSRWWDAATYEERLAAGEEPDSFDKELLRRGYADAGYRGEGDPPVLPPEVWALAGARYAELLERLTGEALTPPTLPVAERLRANLVREGLLCAA